MLSIGENTPEKKCKKNIRKSSFIRQNFRPGIILSIFWTILKDIKSTITKLKQIN